MFQIKTVAYGSKNLKAGSISRKKIFESWKIGKNSVWELHIDANNVNNELLYKIAKGE